MRDIWENTSDFGDDDVLMTREEEDARREGWGEECRHGEEMRKGQQQQQQQQQGESMGDANGYMERAPPTGPRGAAGRSFDVNGGGGVGRKGPTGAR